jgi:hypothetical protein
MPICLISFTNLAFFFTQPLHCESILCEYSGTNLNNHSKGVYKMKKTILIVALVVVALGVLGVGAVFAQDQVTRFVGRGSMMQNGAGGSMHTYMVTEFANKLGLKVDDVNARLTAGETMYDIALSAGVTADKFPALMTEVRTNALDAAVKANVITQEQADWMKSRGFGQSGMMNGANGAGFDGDCPMQDGDTQNGTGFRGGPGGMMNGNGQGRGMMGGWGAGQQQTNP